ncbi:MAG: hypothetical protein ABGY71_02570 [bacterium]|jgi:hypothetical protein|nr:hypothetical protein [Planctomycetota bacterium]HIL51607.1 hypothetical protein [Planctomycetota bacterium]
MSSSISSSKSGSSKSGGGLRFVLLLALLVGAAELAAWALLPINQGRHEADQRLQDVAAAGAQTRVVLLSDSVSYAALELAPAVAGVLDLSTNRAISAAGNCFLIERVLDEAPNIERVVLIVGPHTWTEDLRGKLASVYFTRLFMRPEEMAQVERLLERPDLVRDMAEAQCRQAFLPPSYLRRGALLRPLSSALRDLGQKLRAEQPPPTEPTTQAQAFYDERRAWKHFDPSPVTRAFLPRLAQVCSQRGVRLELLPCPLAPQLVSAWKAGGLWAGYTAWMGALAEQHTTTSFIEACPWPDARDSDFYDGSHLAPAPKTIWGAALAGYLAGE